MINSFLLVVSLLLLSEKSQCQDTTLAVPADYVDDIYHCADPLSWNATDAITCNPDTWKWNVEELDETEPPVICGGIEDLQALPSQTPMDNWMEPCALWVIIYNNVTEDAGE